jgi:ABC-2 type transport system permease protein
MAENIRKQRQMKYGISSAAGILILAGILVALNVIGTRLFVRADMTEGKEFTTSRPTRQILGKLDDIVTIKVFFSKKLPPQLATLQQQLEDMLKEYEVYSKGKVHVTTIDPASKPEYAQQAQSMGIPQLQMNLLEKDQYQVSNVYLGIGVQYGDKTQAIPVVQDVSNLEYDLTSAIVKVTRKDEKTVGLLTGSQERDPQKDLQSLQQALQDQYRVRPVNLNGGRTAVPDDINTLIVAGPKNVPEREKYQIDQYIMHGGKVIFLVDPITMNEQMGLQAYPASSGLDDILSFYGVGEKSALVLDLRNSMAQFAAGYLSYMTQYPLWPKVTKPGLNQQNPITSRLEGVTFPWTAPLEVKATLDPTQSKGIPATLGGAGSTQPNVKASILARTTDKAWTQSGRFDLNPQTAMMRMPGAKGETYPLAVALTGQFQSFYAGKPIPPKPVDAPPPSPDGKTPPPPPPSSEAEPPAVTSSPQTQMLVVGNSEFVTNTFLRMFPENTLFIQNAVDWMTLGNDLIAIRSRGATERPLKELSAGAKTAVKVGLTFGVPILVIAFGLLRGGLRRKNRERQVEAFRPAH